MVTRGRMQQHRLRRKLASPTPMVRRCGRHSATWIRTCLALATTRHFRLDCP